MHRIRALLQRRKVECDLDDELRFHLERQADKHMRAGLARDEAVRRARIDLGGVEQVKEETREAWGVHLIQSTTQDVIYAFRVLGKSRGFAAAVVASLALGIGANTAVFTLMDAVLWRMLPVKNPEGLLVAARQEEGSVYSGFTYPEYRLMRDANRLADLAGYATAPIDVSIDGPPEPSVRGQLVTGSYFPLLGVNPVLGRAINPDDDREPNGHPVVMLSYDYWDRRFARDPSVPGRTIRISGMPFTIIGVAPPGFSGLEIGAAIDLFLPITMQPIVMPAFENLLENPIVNRTWVETIARTRPGISSQQAASALDAIIQNQRRSDGAKADPSSRIMLTQAGAVSTLRREFSHPLLVLLAMVGVLLLTACANIANLLLARAASRRPEFAMRLALGAGRARLMRQLVIESVVLAALGGLCGALLARWATGLLVLYLSSGGAPIKLDLSPNLRILAFTGIVSVLTGILFGLAPAWRAARVDLTPALRNVRSSIARGLRPVRMFVIVQIALTLPLLVGAGLFVRTLQNLSGEDAGGLRQSVVVLKLAPKGSDQRGVPGTAERLDRIYQELIRRVRELPDVHLASMSNSTPTAPTSSSGARIATASGESMVVSHLMAYPNYFAMVGVPFVRGRDFQSADLRESAPAVCIVNEAFVRRVFPGEDPIGKPCMRDRRPPLHGNLRAERREEPYLIVGVVANSRYGNPTGEVLPLLYTTFLQANTGRGQMVLHVRVSGNRAAIIQRIRQEVAAADPAVPMPEAHTLQEEMNAALVQQRLLALLSGVFGALALLLASVGLYGLMAFTAVQRTPEIGIRIALGARRANVVWLVVRDALMLVAIGIAIGVLATVVTAQLAYPEISGLLFRLRATDPVTIAVAAIGLVLVAAFAAYVPARRASGVDPNVVLRAE